MNIDISILMIALTLGVYFAAQQLYRKIKFVLFHPVLLSIVLLISFLKITGISYQDYSEGGKWIEFWLKPAVVALGVPLYLQLKIIGKQLIPIILSQLVGCVAGVISVVLIADFYGASSDVIISLSPKSVTTPIAMEVTTILGGIPSLAAVVVVCVGIFGAMFGQYILKIGCVTNPISQGLAMGTASHAVGTSAAMEWSERYGAYSGLGLTLNGILTALLTPYILQWLGYI